MSAIFYKLFISVVLLFSFHFIANAQNDAQPPKKDRSIIVAGAAKTLEVGGKVTYIIIKETAKLAWKATKFTAGEMVAPAANAIVVKAAPKATLFVLKRGTPIAAKLLLTYLKL